MSAGDREAEAQAKKGEDSASNDRDSRAAAALKQYWCVGLRAVELVSFNICNNYENTFFSRRLSRRALLIQIFNTSHS